jgi:hypothetical protein
LSPFPEVVYAPLSDAFAYITPRPPFWLAVAEQLHWPLASAEHFAVSHPAAVKTPDIFEHSTGVDETVRHEVASGKVIEPVVIVLSEYVPSALAVQVPVTFSDPVTGTFEHPK